MTIKLNIDQFLKKFKANQQLVLDACSATIEKAAYQLKELIVEKTPVGDPTLWQRPYFPPGYVPGTLKKSWGITFGNSQRNTLGQFASSSQILGSSGLSLKLGGGNGKVVIFNPQPYAQRVEEGWSTQAPQGMMRTAAFEWSSLVNQNIKKL